MLGAFAKSTISINSRLISRNICIIVYFPAICRCSCTDNSCDLCKCGSVKDIWIRVCSATLVKIWSLKVYVYLIIVFGLIIRFSNIWLVTCKAIFLFCVIFVRGSIPVIPTPITMLFILPALSVIVNILNGVRHFFSVGYIMLCFCSPIFFPFIVVYCRRACSVRMLKAFKQSSIFEN